MLLAILRRILRKLRDAIVRIILALQGRRATTLRFLNPLYGDTMATFTLPSNKIATIPVIAFDQNGLPIALPGPLGAASSDGSQVTVDLTPDGLGVILTPVGVTGSATITATAGALTATLDVTIEDEVPVPVATSLSFDVANAVLADKP